MKLIWKRGTWDRVLEGGPQGATVKRAIVYHPYGNGGYLRNVLRSAGTMQLPDRSLQRFYDVPVEFR